MEEYPEGRKAFSAMLEILTVHSPVLAAAPVPAPVRADPDDDKFLAAAVAAGVQVLVSGDRHLLDVSGWQDIEVVTLRAFVRQHLAATDS